MSNHETTKKKHLPKDSLVNSISIFVISDSLYSLKKEGKEWRKTDISGNLAYQFLENFYPKVNIKLDVLIDHAKDISQAVTNEINNENDLILTLGGTGISHRDVTIEAITPLLEKTLTGFGELFRLKTYDAVGTVSIMTRAIAGVVKSSCIVCLPGSPNATHLGLEILTSELEHILGLRK